MNINQTVQAASPVRSLVRVQFLGGKRVLTYYNDRFDLKENDLVYVTGCYAGQLARVREVITKFKIRPSDYEIVHAKLETDIHGVFRTLDGNYMFSLDSSITPAQFRPWVIPPKGKNPYRKKLPPCMEEDSDEDEYVIGDGYSLQLSDLENSDDLPARILERGEGYYEAGNVGFLSLQDGVVTAYVEGTQWYELEFKLDGDNVTELYCDCPYPGLCKHAIAVLLLLRECLKDQRFSEQQNFTIIRKSMLWSMVEYSREEIVL